MTEMVQLFGLNFQSDVSAPEYVLNHPNQFILEVSAKDTPSVRRVFEYNPQSRPMLIMLGFA
jgi:hypothetical protein